MSTTTVRETRPALRPAEPGSGRARLLARVERVLACPQCHRGLSSQPGEVALKCPACGTLGQTRDERFEFAEVAADAVASDWLNRIKEVFNRRLSRFYPLAIKVLSPVLVRRLVPRFLATFDLDRQLVADLGCGTSRYGDRVVCVDGCGYDNVHVVSLLEQLPLANGSLDGVFSIAVLEHVTDPAAHVAEIYRVLKPGGRVLCYVPFMAAFHASPYDYQRWTIRGLAQLFADFETIDIGVGAGPTSGLLWVFQEWLALTLSFGSQRLYRVLVPLTWILSPLKLLDLLLAHHPQAHIIASAHYIEARKPGRADTAPGSPASA